jgi:hypothetical protein
MQRSRVLPVDRYDATLTAREPLLTRSLASAIAIGAPLGIIGWLTLDQMPNLTWFVTRLLQHVGQ